jgi:hypothetical protein
MVVRQTYLFVFRVITYLLSPTKLIVKTKDKNFSYLRWRLVRKSSEPINIFLAERLKHSVVKYLTRTSTLKIVQKIVQDRNRLSSWKPITLTDIVVSSTKKRERETIQLSFTLLLTVFFRKYFKLSFVILEHTHTHTQYTHSQYLIYCFKVFSFSHTLYLILPSSP